MTLGCLLAGAWLRELGGQRLARSKALATRLVPA